MPVQEDTSDLWEKMYYWLELNFTSKEYYDEIPRYRTLQSKVMAQKQFVKNSPWIYPFIEMRSPGVLISLMQMDKFLYFWAQEA